MLVQLGGVEPAPVVARAALAPAELPELLQRNRAERRATAPKAQRLTKGEQRQKRFDVSREKGARWSRRERKIARELQARGASLDGINFVDIPRSDFVFMASCIADGSGDVVRSHLKRMRNRVAAGAIVRAALCRQPDGSNRYTWQHETARKCAALCIVLERLSTYAPRAQTQWGKHLKAVPLAALQLLCRDPWTGKKASRSAINGVHDAGAPMWHTGRVGYLRRARGAGLLYRYRLRASDPACERAERLGPSGYTTNRYYIVSPNPCAPQSDALKAKLYDLLDEGWRESDAAPRPVYGVLPDVEHDAHDERAQAPP